MMTFPALYSLYGNADGSHSCKEIHFYLFNVFSLLHACCTEVLLNYCLFVLSVSVCHVLMFLLLLWPGRKAGYPFPFPSLLSFPLPIPSLSVHFPFPALLLKVGPLKSS